MKKEKLYELVNQLQELEGDLGGVDNEYFIDINTKDSDRDFTVVYLKKEFYEELAGFIHQWHDNKKDLIKKSLQREITRLMKELNIED